MSPPSVVPSHESTDSLVNPDSPMQGPPANAQETARNNIIRELVETERKYVQDLEHMQVSRCHLDFSSRPWPGLVSDMSVRPTAIRGCSQVKQRHRPGYDPSPIPWAEQALGLPAAVPDQAGGGSGVAMERTTVGAALHRHGQLRYNAFSLLVTHRILSFTLHLLSFVFVGSPDLLDADNRRGSLRCTSHIVQTTRRRWRYC